MDLVMTNSRRRIHPKKFALYMAMISIVMLFSAFTSAFIVQKASGNWYSFPIPTAYFYSTAVILICSVVLHISYKAFVQKNYLVYKSGLSIALILSILFIGLQYQGWLNLNDLEIFVQTNQSSSFFVMLIGVHALHIIGGIGSILVSWILSVRPSTSKWSEKGQLRMELTCTYWHFMDFIWIYLLIFLWVQQ
jgi:cytochrome c oxidase subunit 3